MKLSAGPLTASPASREVALVWFRRDLRLDDHAALAAALAHSAVVYCVFVFDSDILAGLPRDDRRVSFIWASLVELRERLLAAGGELLLRHGRAPQEITRLALELRAAKVYAAEDYEPDAVARDRAVAEALRHQGMALCLVKDQAIFAGDEVLTQAGRPYTIFTPYKKAWLSELIWRDFFFQVLHHHPHAARGAFRPAFDQLAWPNEERLFGAWCEGRTGYPLVDAAMRELVASGTMHNRLRMVVASFLCKDLLIDWRWGERFFARHLNDFDLAANNGNWQWAASTGCDAQPWFRIFNPVTQSTKFDPQGEYVRSRLASLRLVPDRYIHAPWTMPPLEQEACGCRIGRDYPAPVVDHAVQRERALALYREAQA